MIKIYIQNSISKFIHLYSYDYLFTGFPPCYKKINQVKFGYKKGNLRVLNFLSKIWGGNKFC